jgi:hypothetical protein
MGGGLIQLVAYGIDDIYLTGDPQITFFKVVYRRHTNFTIEQIPQQFINTPNFGKISTCIISRNADLIGGINLVITLPKVRIDSNSQTLFAWVKRVGFSLIKSIEIEINGRIVDTHYGEWLSIWSELTGEINGPHSRGFKNMIGDVSVMTDFTNSKNEYTLFIPLKFWFCRNSGLALPLISLQYSDVKINVEFEEAEKCYMLSPSHYIQCRDDIVNFIPYEYIEQNISGTINAGIFINYDISSKRLYYYKVTSAKLTSITVPSTFDTSSANQAAIDAKLSSPAGLQYSIIGKTSGYSTFAQFNATTQAYPTPSVRNLNFVNCFLLVDYYYLDDDERLRFSQSKHDYLIEQLFFTPNITIDGGSATTQIIVEHPCKLMAWVTQLQSIDTSKDYYNYTNSYQNRIKDDTIYDIDVGMPVGESLIASQTILMNSNPRISLRDGSYFDTIQTNQHTKYSQIPGINIYSYSAYPFMTQPSGTFNGSQIDNIQIQMNLSSVISTANKANFRCYSVCLNILRIVNGLAALVFTR